MNKFENAAPAKSWIKPELKRLHAGSAEAGGTGATDDGVAGGTTDVRDS